jgi:hypothetical protein
MDCSFPCVLSGCLHAWPEPARGCAVQVAENIVEQARLRTLSDNRRYDGAVSEVNGMTVSDMAVLHRHLFETIGSFGGLIIAVYLVRLIP